jgi:hypothetical protein
MRKAIRFAELCALSLPLLVAGNRRAAAQPAAPGGEWARAQTEMLRRAGQRLGIPVRTDRMASVVQNGATFLTAPAANVETMPTAGLRRGAWLAVAYIDVPGQRLPAGFYGLKVFADSQQAGTAARLQVIGADGRLAVEIPATASTTSAALGSRMAMSAAAITLTTPCASDVEHVPPGCAGPFRV